MAVVDLDLREEPKVDIVTAVGSQAVKMNPEGGPILFVVGSGPGVSISRALEERLPFPTVGLEAAVLSTSEEISAVAATAQPDLVIGIGGGAVIDRGKLAAKMAGARYLAVPTALSQDGLYTEHAVLRSPSGDVERFRCYPPDSILPAVEMIEAAPPIFRAACVGDLLSNINAVEDCRLAEKAGKYQVPEEAIELSLEAANIAALSDPEGSPMELFEGIELSGRAMRIAEGSTPCSGAEHKIDSALNSVTGRARSHGLTVAFASAFLMALRSPERLGALLNIMRSHKIPTDLVSLDLSEDEFVDGVELACDLRPSRYTLLDHDRPSRRQIVDVLKFMAEQESLCRD